MPKRGFAALLITTGALILLLSFKTPDQPVVTRPTGVVSQPDQGTGSVTSDVATPSPGATAAPGATKRPAGTTATPAPSTATGNGSGSKTVDGPVVSTQFGDVQVEVVVSSGKLSDVVALELPTGRRSGQISNYAAPILHQEALQAQSAKIDLVSGATYTSDAYAQSLQAALDQAGVG
jgi:uncharacterized protein with FMN-binding domain